MGELHLWGVLTS